MHSSFRSSTPSPGSTPLCFPPRGTLGCLSLTPSESTGPFVRALIEDEEPGTKKLMGYEDYSLPRGDDESLVPSNGKPVKFIETTPEAMREMTNIPLEVLDAPAYLHEFDYFDGIPGAIRPSELKNPPKTNGYKAFLESQDVDDLLTGRGRFDAAEMFKNFNIKH